MVVVVFVFVVVEEEKQKTKQKQTMLEAHIAKNLIESTHAPHKYTGNSSVDTVRGEKENSENLTSLKAKTKRGTT